MKLALLLTAPLVPAAFASPTPLEGTVEPRTVTLVELQSSGFPDEHVLPEDPARAVGRDWVGEWRAALAAERCDGKNVGDVLAELRALREEKGQAALGKRLEELAGSCGELGQRWSTALGELLRTDGLLAESWDPGRNLHDDGILVGPTWRLDGIEREPWSKLRGSDRLFQAGVLLFADLESIKQVENDFPTYPTQIATTYEKIYPKQGTFLVARDEEGRALENSLRIHFRCDLPFPFSDYAVDLDIYNRLNEAGELVTDIWADSDDFHWMAGRDVFVPIRDSQGGFVAMLLLRQFGFDLKGIPDGDDHRREGLRCSLGNLKRRAERDFASYGGPPRTLENALPVFEVRK